MLQRLLNYRTDINNNTEQNLKGTLHKELSDINPTRVDMYQT